MPLYKRIPKKPGMLRHKKIHFTPINLDRINKYFEENEVVQYDSLVKLGIIKSSEKRIKILGNGSLEKKVVINANSFSKTAIEKIEKSGSTYKIVTK